MPKSSQKKRSPHPVPADTKQKKDQASASHGGKNLKFYVAGILIVTAFIFSPSLQDGFTNWDDDLYVTENLLIRPLPGSSFADFFTTNVAGNFHPFTMMTLAVEFRLFGEDPSVFHLTNLLFHLANTLLVFLLIWKLSGRNRFISLFTALVFGIHPMHVESVTWISERKDVLYTFFFLLSLLAYQTEKRRLPWPRYLLAFAFFILSCLAKSAAVVLPVVLILLDAFQRKFSWKRVIALVPFFAVSVLIGLKALETQAEMKALGDIAYFTFYEKFRFASYGFIIYIVKFFVPYGLSAFHPYPSDGIPAFYDISVFLVLALFAGAILLYRKDRTVLFGLLFYSVTIALVLQFITVGNAVIAERYTYVPYIGIGFIVGSLLYRLQVNEKSASRTLATGYRLPATPKHLTTRKIIIYTLTAIYVLAMSVITFNRTKAWKDSYTLWSDVIEKYPDEDGAYVNRGHFLRSINEYDRAMRDYERAITINPLNYRPYHNRGKIYFDRGEVDLAMEDFNRSIGLNPDNAEAYSNRGAAYGLKKDYENALNDINRAIELDPTRKASYSNRAVLNYETSRYDKAISDVNTFLQYEPYNADMINLRGLCHRLAGRFEEAISDYTLAIRYNPAQPAFYLNRSYAYLAAGDKETALQDALQAQKLGMNVEESYLEQLK